MGIKALYIGAYLGVLIGFTVQWSHNDKDVRDLICKGYTIIYKINISKNEIAVVEIFKWIDR